MYLKQTLAALTLAACAADPETLPTQNVDGSAAKPTGAAKADAWDYRNDPARFAQFAQRDFVKAFDQLPKSGESLNKPWPDTYWPTFMDSTNARWTGDANVDGFSPAEKYDLAFNGWTPASNFAQMRPFSAESCSAEWDADYYANLGPLARFVSENRGNKNGRNKQDDDGDMKIDECEADGIDGVERWWGLCHAWVPAALNEPEPIHAVVENGVTFYPSDIKALMIQAYNRSKSMILGGRCNEKEPKRDERGRIIDPACRDTNAGAFHVVVTNMIGRHKLAIAEDRTYDYEVWNQPVYRYEITAQDEVDLAKALVLVQSTDADYSKINKDAKRFVDVRMTLNYVTESEASKEPKTPELEHYTRRDSYHYLLELDAAGTILGGEWINGGTAHPEWGNSRQPDFLWFSTGPADDYGTPLEYSKVKALLAKSRAPIVPEAEGGGSMPVDPSKVNVTKAAALLIPDNNRTGVKDTLTLDRAEPALNFAVQLDVKHSYVGDLSIVLQKNGRTVKKLWDKKGGSGDDIHDLINVPEMVGKSLKGVYTLKLVDGAAEDEGSLEQWGIVATVQPAM